MIHGSRCLIFSLFSKRRHPLVIIWLDTWLKPPSSAAPLPRMRRSPPRRPDRFSFGVAGASADPRLSRRVTRLIRVRGPERRADIRPGVSARAPPSTCVSTPASPPRTAPPAPLSAAACPPVLPTRPRPVRPPPGLRPSPTPLSPPPPHPTSQPHARASQPARPGCHGLTTAGRPVPAAPACLLASRPAPASPPLARASLPGTAPGPRLAPRTWGAGAGPARGERKAGYVGGVAGVCSGGDGLEDGGRRLLRLGADEDLHVHALHKGGGGGEGGGIAASHGASACRGRAGRRRGVCVAGKRRGRATSY